MVYYNYHIFYNENLQWSAFSVCSSLITPWEVSQLHVVFVLVRFEVQIKFSIPNIIVEPTLDVCQKVIVDVTNAILEATSGQSSSWNMTSFCFKDIPRHHILLIIFPIHIVSWSGLHFWHVIFCLAQPKTDKWISSRSHFSLFSCCLSVIL